MEAQPHPFEAALSLKEYDKEDCLSAIRGKKIPRALGYTISRLCTIRGIRYHPGFATELHGSWAEFTRALNARSIMSGSIPEITNPEEFPYCIWHPEIPSQEACRELLRRYPHMKYHVGRVCAVAGYTELFHELDLLPEVHIAEEARDNGSTAIFDAILANPVKYAVMNDYYRRLEETPRVGNLNDDTAVRSSLDIKQKFRPPISTDRYQPHTGDGTHDTLHYFNITEDYGVDEYNSEKVECDSKILTPLLYTPLPADLPAVNKDLLILMAAYYGDVDRYARLRRPIEMVSEFQCVIHGIYTNTMFAKWWTTQVPEPEIEEPPPNEAEDDDDDDEEEEEIDSDEEEPWYKCSSLTSSINRAITARFIMVNDLSRITPEIFSLELPYTIWHPLVPLEETLEELVRRKPDMKPQAARACIVGDYQQLYDKIDSDTDSGLLEEARLSHNPYYLKDLEDKLKAGRGTDKDHYLEPWRRLTHTSLRLGTTDLQPNISVNDVVPDFWSIYEGTLADPSRVELHVCVPEELKVNPPQYLRLWST
ncbi:hypothetical protein FQN54_007876 [Arachnomyces sp. PD_36]|nr:hypothetical protein FQN54_007876 [Arachnomyces sp. PD_36]